MAPDGCERLGTGGANAGASATAPEGARSTRERAGSQHRGLPARTGRRDQRRADRHEGRRAFLPRPRGDRSGWGGAFYAVDIKVAQRKILKKRPPTQTQSRITLYTGNTYFAYPTLHWPGTFRPFADYPRPLDVVGISTLNRDSASRVEDLELIVQEPWRIGSHQRSSTTREYIGAVVGLDDLRHGRGEFKTEAEFYKFWRAFNFNIGRSVRNQLNKLLAQQARPAPKD